MQIQTKESVVTRKEVAEAEAGSPKVVEEAEIEFIPFSLSL
jgi:hypothetical protein